MRRVVSWVLKSKGRSLAKGSPRIITASACALIITYHMEENGWLENQEINFTTLNSCIPYWSSNIVFRLAVCHVWHSE